MELAVVLYRRQKDEDGRSNQGRLTPSELNAILTGARLVKETAVKNAHIVLFGEKMDQELISYCAAFGFNESLFVEVGTAKEASAPWGVNEVVSMAKLLGVHLILSSQYPQEFDLIDPSPLAASLLGYEYIPNVASLSVNDDQVEISQRINTLDIHFISERPTFAAMAPTSSEVRPLVSDEIKARSGEIKVANFNSDEIFPSPKELAKLERFIRPSIRTTPIAKKASARRDQLLEGTPKRSKEAKPIGPIDGARVILEKIDEARR